MGKDSCRELASLYSWWWDSHNHPHQSQWLQATLSDLDKKVKMMLNLLEDDGESFVKRAEMYYEKRPEMIKMVEDLHRSYRCLAEKYDQIRAESSELGAESRSLPDSFHQLRHLQINSLRSWEKIVVPEAPKSHPDQTIGFDVDGEKIVDLCSSEREATWNGLRLKVSGLIEENLHLQAELIRRNEDKRVAIIALRKHINRLIEENKDRLTGHNKVDTKQNQSRMSRIKEFVLRKLLR